MTQAVMERQGLREAVDSLMDELSALATPLSDLTRLADDKLAALRNANAARLREVSEEEPALITLMAELDRRRSAVLTRLAQALRSPDLATARVSEIANHLPEPHASRIRAKTAGLQRLATDLQKKNNLAGEVARALHMHVRHVFAELAKTGQESIGYGPTGQDQRRSAQLLIDAVG
ncbi:MAG: flagellar export chaperone FlgN [Phycisphaerales bacterium]|nr:flagellar export chaperone FlgN [Phycisphaerales bacterium]